MYIVIVGRVWKSNQSTANSKQLIFNIILDFYKNVLMVSTYMMDSTIKKQHNKKRNYKTLITLSSFKHKKVPSSFIS